jgi:hypothetical protein
MATLMMPNTRRTTFAPPRLSLEMAGLLTLLIGAWGGGIAFIGPTFGFSGDGSGSWHWNLAHSLLFLAPGAIAVAMGLLTMIVGASARGRRALADLGGLMIVTCGAWFIVGPLAWPVIENAQVFRSAGPLRELAYWIAYSLGPGALLMSLGAFVIGRARYMVALDTSSTMIDEPPTS